MRDFARPLDTWPMQCPVILLKGATTFHAFQPSEFGFIFGFVHHTILSNGEGSSMTNVEDASEQQVETPEEFERSSLLFYEAERLRYWLENPTAAEQKFREAMDATGNYGVFYHLAQGRFILCVAISIMR